MASPPSPPNSIIRPGIQWAPLRAFIITSILVQCSAVALLAVNYGAILFDPSPVTGTTPRWTSWAWLKVYSIGIPAVLCPYALYYCTWHRAIRECRCFWLIFDIIAAFYVAYCAQSAVYDFELCDSTVYCTGITNGVTPDYSFIIWWTCAWFFVLAYLFNSIMVCVAECQLNSERAAAKTVSQMPSQAFSVADRPVEGNSVFDENGQLVSYSIETEDEIVTYTYKDDTVV